MEPQRPEWIAPSTWDTFDNDAKHTIANIPRLNTIDPQLRVVNKHVTNIHDASSDGPHGPNPFHRVPGDSETRSCSGAPGAVQGRQSMERDRDGKGRTKGGNATHNEIERGQGAAGAMKNRVTAHRGHGKSRGGHGVSRQTVATTSNRILSQSPSSRGSSRSPRSSRSRSSPMRKRPRSRSHGATRGVHKEQQQATKARVTAHRGRGKSRGGHGVSRQTVTTTSNRILSQSPSSRGSSRSPRSSRSRSSPMRKRPRSNRILSQSPSSWDDSRSPRSSRSRSSPMRKRPRSRSQSTGATSIDEIMDTITDLQKNQEIMMRHFHHGGGKENGAQARSGRGSGFAGRGKKRATYRRNRNQRAECESDVEDDRDPDDYEDMIKLTQKDLSQPVKKAKNALMKLVTETFREICGVPKNTPWLML